MALGSFKPSKWLTVLMLVSTQVTQLLSQHCSCQSAVLTWWRILWGLQMWSMPNTWKNTVGSPNVFYAEYLEEYCWVSKCVLCGIHAAFQVLNTLSGLRFGGILLDILNDVKWSNEATHKHWHLVKICRKPCNLIVWTVPADGLAPLGARTSAGTVMTIFGYCIHRKPAF